VSSKSSRDYDTTIARIAGNITPAMVDMPGFRLPNGAADGDAIAKVAVAMARAIVAEVKRTEVVVPEPVPLTYVSRVIGSDL
jgi:hypothetical protein